LILLIAAWVINRQVVRQARAQLQIEIETLLPVYDAIRSEYAAGLGTLGATMANSSIAKTVFGDPRAARDRATLHEMVEDFSLISSTPLDLFAIADGAGAVTFAEKGGITFALDRLDGARTVATSQEPRTGFAILGDRLFQLAMTPILLHSGNVDYRNTLAVIVTGAELNREMAAALKQRMHSEVVFLLADRVYASSLAPEAEAHAARAIFAARVEQAAPSHPVEIQINGEPYLAFARDLSSPDEQSVGQVVVLRSLAGAGQLFQAISNRLLLLWTLSIAAALVISYLIANRITRPIETLLAGVEEFGRGNYEYAVPKNAKGEIGALAQAFDGMRRSLKQTQAALLRSERLATIGQMASSIVHDLRNPLATITTAAEVLGRDGIAPARRNSLLDTQLRASQRMNEMLRELLEFSRGAYQLDLAPYDLAEIVAWAVQEFAPVLERRQVDLQVDVPSEINLRVDGERLRRVLENLIDNAIHAVEQQGGRIIVRARPGDQVGEKNGNLPAAHVRVDVIDDGPGVPLEIRERIFEPFISYGKSGGTGLGLAIARGLIEAHGGLIGLDDLPRRGSDFYFILPLDEVSGSEI
jgi:signal transduction histidine kinase